ncbi:undecaprenyl-phosphate glucose phosphotransferase [Romboutsia ilealis]|uniref:undecaprenyl-phosphate glucose phosphotransferase n=2 Tax=Romboutsia ilealis TaxID=1115758 RepID=UPI002F41261D
MVIIVVSFLFAYYIRFYILDGHISMSFKEFFIPILISIPMYLLLYTIFDLYTAKRTKSIYKEIFDIVKVNFAGALILILGLYVFKIVNFSRVTLAIFIILNTTITSINRICLRYTLRKYRKKGLNQKHCLIIGATNTSKELINRINKNKHWGYNVVGIIDNHKNNDEYFEGFKVIGNFEDIEYVLDHKHIDIVFIAISAEEYIHIGSLLKACERGGVKTNIIPYYHKYVPAKPRMDDLDGLTMVDTRYVPLDSYIMAFSKRIFDIVFSLFAIILASPIMLLSVIMIKLTSPGPVIYKQERVGLNRKKFYMYKFRSMKVQTEEEEKTKWSTKNDPRKTKWGSFMRKTSIDELPQFFNVLKGDMSIIGPRPERPYFVEKFRDEIPRYMIKHQVRPGITGWAQVSGFRGDTSIEGRIEHDLEYIENWTFFFDIKIVFLTIFNGFVNKNAY